MIRMGLGLMLVLAPVQLLIGDSTACHGRAISRPRSPPWKGIGTVPRPAPLVLFAWPDAAERAQRLRDRDPASRQPAHHPLLERHFPGLKDVPPADRPPWPNLVLRFPRDGRHRPLSDRDCAASGHLLWLRGTLFENRFFLRLASWSWPIGFVAIICGWTSPRVGRQPWLATGIMRTVDCASPLPAPRSLATLILFVIVYSRRVRHRHRLHQPADRQGPAARGRSPRRRRAQPAALRLGSFRAALPEASR